MATDGAAMKMMQAVLWVTLVVGTLLEPSTAAWVAAVVCPNTGAFTREPPFDGVPLPFCEDRVQPVYDMYTRNNSHSPQALERNTVPSIFDPSRMTVFVVHGFYNNRDTPWLHEMKDALLDRADVNVVIVGWGGLHGAEDIQYSASASTTRVVGADLGDAIDNLVANAGGVKSRLWCFGHSLGAHVCGFAGRRHNQLGRITGMDPAGPEFANNPDRQIGLWIDCADFVDTINTNSHYGSTPLGLGHQNYYPNGGSEQLGCTDGFCSHDRSYYYMTESIKDDCFIARKVCADSSDMPSSCKLCGDACVFMGYAATSSTPDGNYYLETQAEPPYCLH